MQGLLIVYLVWLYVWLYFVELNVVALIYLTNWEIISMNDVTHFNWVYSYKLKKLTGFVVYDSGALFYDVAVIPAGEDYQGWVRGRGVQQC